MRKYTVLVLLILSSCTSTDICDNLDRAASIIDDDSRGAAEIIDSIDDGLIRDEHTKAYRALLKSLSNYKLDIYPESDSLLKYVYRHYQDSHEDKSLKMKSDFVFGDYLEHKGDYSSAIILYRKALKIGEEIHDYYYAGLAARGAGYCYRFLLSPADALDMMLKARELFDKAGKDYHKYCVSIRIAEIYSQILDFDSAENEFVHLIPYFIDKKDTVALHDTYKHYNALLLKSKKMHGTVIESYRDLSHRFGIKYDSYDCGILALAYAIRGDRMNAEKMIEDCLKLANGAYAEYWSHEWRYQAMKELGDYKTAVEEAEAVNLLSEPLITETMTKSVAVGQSNLYYSLYRQELKESSRLIESNNIKLLIIFIIATLLLVAALICACLTKVLHRQKSEITTLNETVRRYEKEAMTQKSPRIPPGKFLLDRISKLYIERQTEYLGQADMDFIKDIQDNKQSWKSIRRTINDSTEGIPDLFQKELKEFTKDDEKLFA